MPDRTPNGGTACVTLGVLIQFMQCSGTCAPAYSGSGIAGWVSPFQRKQ